MSPNVARDVYTVFATCRVTSLSGVDAPLVCTENAFSSRVGAGNQLYQLSRFLRTILFGSTGADSAEWYLSVFTATGAVAVSTAQPRAPWLCCASRDVIDVGSASTTLNSLIVNFPTYSIE